MKDLLQALVDISYAVALCRARAGRRPLDMATPFYAKTSLLRTQRWQNETACTGKNVTSLTNDHTRLDAGHRDCTLSVYLPLGTHSDTPKCRRGALLVW